MNVVLIIAEVIFWSSVFLAFHSYVLYPFLLSLFTKNKKSPNSFSEGETPFISIIIAAFNEEEVIAEKINSILNNSISQEKYEILIGSDASTDKTDDIVKELASNNANIHFTRFNQRQGKGNIINQLTEKAKGDILLFTDANIIFAPNTIFEMAKFFKQDNIGLVDANMNSRGIKKSGISMQENSYISYEVKIKNREGKLWGTMMGPFGGCFAVRKNYYSPVPSNFLVDDFYINMKILESGKKTINNLDAIVFEDISNDLKEEFRRKVRISTGNFQNLFCFFKLLFSNIKGLSFSFFSHKVLRWMVPFFLVNSLAANVFLIRKHWIYYIPLAIQVFLIIIPFIDLFLRKIRIHIVILRFITHFYVMNVALFLGFIKFLKGVKTNVWQPTKRNQV